MNKENAASDAQNPRFAVSYTTNGASGRTELQLNHFNQNVLSPYLNYHRPCLFAREHVDAKGKIRKTYPAEKVATPYEKLKSLTQASRYLKPGIDFEQLDAGAYRISDNDAARQLNDAKAELFQSINQAQNPAA